jgi:hypothetical protein
MIGAAVAAVACGPLSMASGPSEEWPTVPERLPAAPASASAARLTCTGEHSFDTEALEQPSGAEHRRGPAFDALREAFVLFKDEFRDAERLAWILVDQDDEGALFLADGERNAGWIAVEIEFDNETGEWKPVSMSQCDPHVRLSPEFGPAVWALNPAYPAPNAETVELNILVWEVACSSGRPTTGRMSPPAITLTEDSATIIIGVRPLEGFQDCPRPPGTPAIVVLPEQLGDRILLDGGHHPPAEPSPPP